jgi:hypothetical protein
MEQDDSYISLWLYEEEKWDWPEVHEHLIAELEDLEAACTRYRENITAHPRYKQLEPERTEPDEFILNHHLAPLCEKIDKLAERLDDGQLAELIGTLKAKSKALEKGGYRRGDHRPRRPKRPRHSTRGRHDGSGHDGSGRGGDHFSGRRRDGRRGGRAVPDAAGRQGRRRGLTAHRGARSGPQSRFGGRRGVCKEVVGMNMFEAGSCAGAVAGAVAGVWLGLSLYGWAGALAGLLAGTAAGWVGMPFLLFVVFAACVLSREGAAGLRDLILNRDSAKR